MSSCIVTCIYDLYGRSPEYFHRPPEEYALMLNYHKQFNLPIHCFTEQSVVQYIPEGITVHVVDYDDLPTIPLIPNKGRGMSNVMKNGTVHQGHVHYSIVTNSKVFFMNTIAKEHNEYDTIIWLDSGIEHVDPCDKHRAIEAIEDVISDDRSRLCMINYPTYINLDYNTYNIASGMHSLKKKDIRTILDAYIEELINVKNKGYVCLEEQIWTLVYMRLKDLFSIRFTDYRPITNTKYITTDKDVILRNITVLPEHLRDELIDVFIKSISNWYLRMEQMELLNKIIDIYKCSSNVQLGRILYNLNKFKNYTNNPNYKGRLDIRSVVSRSQLTFKDQEEYSSIMEYITAYPEDRLVIRTLI